MGENDDLVILIEAALDFAKSIQSITTQLQQVQQKLASYRLKITAGLDQATSASQIRQDLQKLDKSRRHISLTGKIDQAATKAEVDKTLKRLRGSEIKLSAVLDTTTAAQQLGQEGAKIPPIDATANVNVNGTEQVEDLSRKMQAGGKNAAGFAANVYLARTALTALRTTVREAVQTITELDSAVTDLSMATGQNREGTYNLLRDYNELARQLGATTTQVAQAADEWLRQGKTAQETVGLIEQAMILSKVAQLDSSAATERLTSALLGYKLEAADAAGIVDKLTAVDLHAAVTAGDLAEAMSRTANGANIAGVEMDRLLGYLAAVQETTQRSASTVGESFKTIFARMGNVKLGKFVDDESGEDLSDVEKVLRQFDIALRSSNDEFRDFGDILDDVAAKWENLSTVDKNALATTMAGTRQRENFLVLMENYGKALEYAGIAADSSGTAMEKFGLYQESIEAKSAAFVAALENLTLDTVDIDFVGDLIDAGTAVVDFIDKIDLLKAALVGLGVGGLLKGISAVSNGFLTAKQNILNLGSAIQILRNVGSASQLSGEEIQNLGLLSKGLSNEQLRLVLTSKQLSAEQMRDILAASGLTNAEIDQKLATLGLAGAQETATVATGGFSAAMTGLGAALKAAFAANPIGMITAARNFMRSTTPAASSAAGSNPMRNLPFYKRVSGFFKSLWSMLCRRRSTLFPPFPRSGAGFPIMPAS